MGKFKELISSLQPEQLHNNLKERGILNDEVRDNYAIGVTTKKYTGLRSEELVLTSVPDRYLFQLQDEVLELIDFFSLVLSPVGGDVIFDVLGATYTLVKGDYGSSALYAGSVVLPFVAGGSAKQLVNVSEQISSVVRKKPSPEIVQQVFKAKGDEKLLAFCKKIEQSEVFSNHQLLAKIDLLDPSDARILLQDLAENPNFLDALVKNSNLVDSWRSFKNAGLDDLAKNTDNLDALNKAKKQDGYDAAYFENLLKSKQDPQKFINDYVKKIGDNGKFLDEALENDYTSYLTRKAREGKPPRDRADWNHARDYWLNDSPLARGNAFNETARIERWYPFNEVVLSNGKRLDSYKLPKDGKPGEIISRKATDLSDIQLSTFESYLSEMKIKYAPGTPINAPKYGDLLKGKKLEGDMILELPNSNLNLSNIQDYIDLANSKGITLRFKPE